MPEPHDDGSAAGRNKPQGSSAPPPSPEPRRTAEKLPPPFFLLLLLLFLAFVFFTTTRDSDRDNYNIVVDSSTFSVSSSVVTETLTVTVNSAPSATPKPVVSQNNNMAASEQTFIAIKPDGVQRGLVGPIISRFENRGFKLVAIKLVTPGEDHLKTHYEDLKDKPFFAGLVKYMNSGPICAMVWEGRDAVKTGRTILGATNPLASAPGTIRGDFAIDVGRNVCHGSDSVESAKKEIALWFKAGELVQWKSAQNDWIYEKP